MEIIIYYVQQCAIATMFSTFDLNVRIWYELNMERFISPPLKFKLKRKHS